MTRSASAAPDQSHAVKMPSRTAGDAAQRANWPPTIGAEELVPDDAHRRHGSHVRLIA